MRIVHSGEKWRKSSFDLIFIMYMINYCIASDYQKIVRDIIFYMYLISVHSETCALAGPNAELFFFFLWEEFQLHAHSQIDGKDCALKKSLGLFSNWSQEMQKVSQMRKDQSRAVPYIRAPQSCSTALKLGQYIRESYQHLCQHCFKRNMRFFFPFRCLLLFNTSA